MRQKKSACFANASLKGRATISYPAGYGFKERWDDWKSYNIEDVGAEEPQLIARIEAFDQRPEGRSRARIESLAFIGHA